MICRRHLFGMQSQLPVIDVGMASEVGQGGAEASPADDDDAGHVDPEQQEHHAPHRAVDRAVVDELRDDVNEEGLPQLKQDRDHERRNPDLGETDAAPRRQHIEDGKGVEKDEGASHIAADIDHGQEAVHVEQGEVTRDDGLQRVEETRDSLEDGRDHGADNQGAGHGEDHEKILQRHLPPGEAPRAPGVIDREHQGLEEAEGSPRQDQDGDDAHAATRLFQATHHAPEQLLLIISHRDKPVDGRHHGVPREKIRAKGQEERDERHQREEGVVGEGRRVLFPGDAVVDGDRLPEEMPQEESSPLDVKRRHEKRKRKRAGRQPRYGLSRSMLHEASTDPVRW